MRAFSSGALAGLQGLSDTLGGTAEFQRDTQVINRRQQQEEAQLQQRQAEESRRQQSFALDLQQAQRRMQQEESQSAYHFQRAQQAIGEQRDQVFDQMMGGPPTVDQARELEQLNSLTGHMTDPKNAIAMVDEWQAKKGKDTAMAGLAQVAQDIQRPLMDGTLQDPIAQQQLQMLPQALQWLGQQIQGGGVKADEAPRLVDRLMDRYNTILGDAGKRTAELGARQGAALKVKEVYSAMDPMKDAQKMQRLMEIEQGVMMGIIPPREALKETLQQAYDVEVILPEEKQAALQQQMMLAVGQQGGVYGSPAGGGMGPGPDRPSTLGASAGMPTTNGQAKKNPRGLLVRFRDAVRSSDKSPQAIQAIQDQLGIQDLSPEEEEFLFGG